MIYLPVQDRVYSMRHRNMSYGHLAIVNRTETFLHRDTPPQTETWTEIPLDRDPRTKTPPVDRQTPVKTVTFTHKLCLSAKGQTMISSKPCLKTITDSHCQRVSPIGQIGETR